MFTPEPTDRPETAIAIRDMVNAIERFANTGDDTDAIDAMYAAQGAYNGLEAERGFHEVWEADA